MPVTRAAPPGLAGGESTESVVAGKSTVTASGDSTCTAATVAQCGVIVHLGPPCWLVSFPALIFFEVRAGKLWMDEIQFLLGLIA